MSVSKVAADWFKDGRFHWGVGIEDTFIPQERPGHRKLDLYELTQHYENWRGDLQLAADSGAELIRWGIPWYMTERTPGQFDFTWTDQVGAEMDRLGLRCVVDLMHYGTPLWLTDSFLDPRYPELVARYAGAVAARYAHVFNDFTPLNEPMVNALWCGLDGKWPPYLTGYTGFVSVLMPLVEGWIRSQQAIKAAAPSATIVAVDAGFLWAGELEEVDEGAKLHRGRNRPFLEQWRFLALDLAMGKVTDVHPLWPFLIESGASEAKLRDFTQSPAIPDVLGVNYYPGFTTQSREAGETSDHAVEAGTGGLIDLISTYASRYPELPLAITETSRISEDPAQKIQWIDDLVATVGTLGERGITIHAAFWFPFIDMFEWEYRFAHTPLDDHQQRFGLVDLVRGADNRLTRHPNTAYDHFRSRRPR